MADVTPEIGPDVRPCVEDLLQRAVRAGASDIHLEPTANGMDVRFRLDGLLENVEELPGDVGRSAVLRLMVMAQLLTYRLDIPQEGRIRMTGDAAQAGRAIDLRLAVIPVAHGLRAVVRLPADLAGVGGRGGWRSGGCRKVAWRCCGRLRKRMRGCCW